MEGHRKRGEAFKSCMVEMVNKDMVKHSLKLGLHKSRVEYWCKSLLPVRNLLGGKGNPVGPTKNGI